MANKNKAKYKVPVCTVIEKGWLSVWADFCPTMLPHDFSKVGFEGPFTSLDYDPLPDWHEDSGKPFRESWGTTRHEAGYIWYNAQYFDPEHPYTVQYGGEQKQRGHHYRLYLAGGDDSMAERYFTSQEEMINCLAILKRLQPVTWEQIKNLGFHYWGVI